MYLVEIFRQLFVAAQFLAGDVGHHFFAGGLNDEIARVSVLDAQQLGAHFFKAARLLPELGGLHHRHGHLDGTGAVHLLAHDGLDLADHAQAHGHVVVDAGAQALANSSSSGNGSVVLNPGRSTDVLTETLRQTIAIPPTINVPQGSRLQVFVARDVDFRSVYALKDRS